MRNKPLDPRTRRRNLVFAAALVCLALVLVVLALYNVSPEVTEGHDSLLTR